MGRAGLALWLFFFSGAAQGKPPAVRGTLIETIARHELPGWLVPTKRAEVTARWLPPLGRYGLPWEEPVFQRVELLDLTQGRWLLSLGTVGALQTGFGESDRLAGARLFSVADVPGIRLGTRESPWELGAGMLVGINSNFTPGDAWGLLTFGRGI